MLLVLDVGLLRGVVLLPEISVSLVVDLHYPGCLT